MNKQSSNKRLFILELIFYVLLPYALWNFGREPLGDYIAMLVSTVPGIIYTIYRFILDKQFNLIGVFILGSLSLGMTVNLLSGSAEQMIWNGVYLSLFYTCIYLVTFLIKRPLSLYFAVEFTYLQGYAREDSKALFYKKGIFYWFQVIQIVFIIRGIFLAALTVFLLEKHGIDRYGSMIINKQIAGWVFSIIVIGMYFYIDVIVRRYFSKQQMQHKENNNGEILQSKVMVE